MLFKKRLNRDQEVLECIMSVLYHDGVFVNANIDSIMNAWALNPLDDREMLKYLRGLNAQGLIVNLDFPNTFNEPSVIRKANIALSPEGEKVMLKHGSYLKYKKKENSKERQETVDRNIRNGNIILSVIVLCSSVILTQCPRQSNKQQQQTEQEMKSLAKKLDSLRQDLHTLQDKR